MLSLICLLLGTAVVDEMSVLCGCDFYLFFIFVLPYENAPGKLGMELAQHPAIEWSTVFSVRPGKYDVAVF